MADDNNNSNNTADCSKPAAEATTTTKKKATTTGPPTNIPPKPKLSKAERRALQEQQRAAKAARTTLPGSSTSTSISSKLVKPEAKASSSSSVLSHPGNATAPAKPAPTKEDPNATAKPVLEKTSSSSHNTTTNITNNLLVGHLTRVPPVAVTFETGAVLRATTKLTGVDHQLPDAAVRLGYLYATGQVRGGNARCRAMLECYKEILATTTTSSTTPVDVMIKLAFQFWTTQCRPHSITMGNAFTFLKAAVASLMQQQQQTNTSASAATSIRETLIESIETYQQERIEYADKAIADIAGQKLLSNRDEVILTFGYSEAVTLVLQEAKMKRVIVVDSLPLSEGLYTLDALSSSSSSSSTTPEYIDISALTYVLPEVDKVLLGAAALQTDGSVTGRIGTAVVALAAHAHHIPVIVCAETYKISNRGVPLESLTHNEVLLPAAADGSATTSFLSLQLLYDLTPAKWISGIVTELGLVPPSSVAVLLREMNPQEFMNA